MRQESGVFYPKGLALQLIDTFDRTYGLPTSAFGNLKSLSLWLEVNTELDGD